MHRDVFRVARAGLTSGRKSSLAGGGVAFRPCKYQAVPMAAIAATAGSRSHSFRIAVLVMVRFLRRPSKTGRLLPIRPEASDRSFAAAAHFRFRPNRQPVPRLGFR